MRRPALVILAALALSLAASTLYVFHRAARSGIAIRWGKVATPVLAPPRPFAPSAEARPVPLYTNEKLHGMLQEETSSLGIKGIVPRGEIDSEEAPEGFLGSRLGRPDSHTLAETAMRHIAHLRQGVEAGKKPEVPIAGSIVPLLSAPEKSGALELAPQAAAPARREAPATEFLAGSWSGLYGGNAMGTFTISDPQAWTQLWSGLSRQPVPAVDFSRQAVVGVFLGPRPTGGFRVEIEPEPTPSPTSLVVRYRVNEPVPGRTPPEGGTAPFALRAIARTSLPVRFEKVP